MPPKAIQDRSVFIGKHLQTGEPIRWTSRDPDEAEKAQTHVDVYSTAKPGSWQRVKRFLGFTEGRDNTRETREE